ncbi:YmgG-like glycine-zipper protein [Chitinophaga niastensis]|uniref:YmgG-like glycine-zipper protein n=1 Tax=Chitinophaga niastensis TaxID=536980 RepID=A0A2P8H9K1_CHINA|nr:YMGG-like glycine zipper-containing protein [Chitinophaga niastensis]PSL42884.1 YmgG-like glycine-zipper protein [Chitinophaga niastensis]
MKQVFVALATAVVLFSCKSNADTGTAIEEARKETIDSMNNVSAISATREKVIDSMRAVKRGHERYAPGVSNNENGYSTAPAANEANNNTVASTPAPTPVVKKKKGWSHTAKGAVVGAGAGAITGALINRDHLKGAAIGTLIGAGVGAGTGAIVDYEKKKRALNNQ